MASHPDSKSDAASPPGDSEESAEARVSESSPDREEVMQVDPEESVVIQKARGSADVDVRSLLAGPDDPPESHRSDTEVSELPEPGSDGVRPSGCDVRLYPGSVLAEERYTIRRALEYPLYGARMFLADGPGDQLYVALVRLRQPGWLAGQATKLSGKPGLDHLVEALTEGDRDMVFYQVEEPPAGRMVDRAMPADDRLLASALLSELLAVQSMASEGLDVENVRPESFAVFDGVQSIAYLDFPGSAAEGGEGRCRERFLELAQLTAVRIFGRNTTHRLNRGAYESLPFSRELCELLSRNAGESEPIEREELASALAALASPGEPQLETAALTDVGVRRTLNEDAIGLFSQECYFESCHHLYRLWIVCDGMGGHEGGEVASRLTVRALSRAIADRITSVTPENAPSRLRDNAFVRNLLLEAIDEANNAIVALGETEAYRFRRDRPGSTLCFVMLEGRTAFFGWVGDSRGYLLRDGDLLRVTRDHSLNQQQIDAGQLSEEEAFDNENSNIILASIGTKNLRLKDVVIRTLKDRDRVLLCTDGICGVLRDSEIRELVGAPGSSAAVCQGLVDAANRRGGPDNSSVIVTSMLPEPPAPQVD